MSTAVNSARTVGRRHVRFAGLMEEPLTSPAHRLRVDAEPFLPAVPVPVQLGIQQPAYQPVYAAAGAPSRNPAGHQQQLGIQLHSDLDEDDYAVPDGLHDDIGNVDDSGMPPPCACCSLPLGSCPEYMAEHIATISAVHNSGLPNQDLVRIPLHSVKTDPDTWDRLLTGYFDREAIVAALRYGWDLGLDSSPEPRDAAHNHPSARDQEPSVEKYIQTELAHGCLLGPINPATLPFMVRRAPLATVPKKDSLLYRVITDCTDAGYGINMWIAKHMYRGENWKLSLPTLDDIVDHIQATIDTYPGEDVLGAKLDLSRYFRNIFVDPGQTHLLGIGWKGKTYLDMAFSFGNRRAMVAAQRMSEAIAWVYRTRLPVAPGKENPRRSCTCPDICKCGGNRIKPYVDDFLEMFPRSLAIYLWNLLLDLVQELGLPLSSTPGHVVPPSQQFLGLGWAFDLATNTVAVPEDKLVELQEILGSWEHRCNASLKDLQRLLGKLHFVSQVVRPGRLHVSRMLDTLRRAEHTGKPTSLDVEFKLDIAWWTENLRHWSGTSTLRFADHQNKVATDASTDGALYGGPGLGGYNFITNEWFKCGVPPEMQDWTICDLELAAITICVLLWGHQWAGQKIWGLSSFSRMAAPGYTSVSTWAGQSPPCSFAATSCGSRGPSGRSRTSCRTVRAVGPTQNVGTHSGKPAQNWGSSLLSPMSPLTCSKPYRCICPGKLSREYIRDCARQFQSWAWAESTRNCLNSQQRSFINFSTEFNIHAFPADGDTLVDYAAYLVLTGHLKAVGSLHQYLSAVSTLHRMYGFTCHTPSTFGPLLFTIIGIQRRLSRPTRKMLPITPEILYNLLTCPVLSSHCVPGRRITSWLRSGPCTRYSSSPCYVPQILFPRR